VVKILDMKALLFVCLAFPLTLLADGGLPNQPYIYVEGKANIEKPADLATMRFNVVGRSPELIKANREAQSKAIRVLGILDEKRVPKTDVIASDVKSEAQSENQKVTGYMVTRIFEVKIRELGEFSKLIDDLTALGVEFYGIEAGLSNDKELQEEIWKKSLVNARERAEKTLQEVGMKIDSVFAISPVAFPRIRPAIFGTEDYPVPLGETNAAETPMIASQYRLPPVAISQNVHVIYLISPAK
jgi:uncharacterized protein YggE